MDSAAPTRDSEMVLEFLFVCISLRTIGNTFTTAPSCRFRAVLLARVVSSVLAGDCVRPEVLASQLRGTESRATTGNPTVRVIDGNHWGCPELPSSPPMLRHLVRIPQPMCVAQFSFAYSAFRMGMSGFPRLRPYAPAADASTADCFAGASATSATPTIPSKATATSNSPRSLAIWNACMNITAA
jgi:hypothetical protein